MQLWNSKNVTHPTWRYQSPLQISGYIRLDLILGRNILSVEAFVLSTPGSDVMQLDNSIM